MPNNKEISCRKVPLGLIPPEIYEGVARAFEFGGNRHGKNNYRIAGKITTYTDAAFRHQISFNAEMEDDTDEDSGLHHLDLAIADLMIARLYSMNLYKEHRDDRFIKESGRPILSNGAKTNKPINLKEPK